MEMPSLASAIDRPFLPLPDALSAIVIVGIERITNIPEFHGARLLGVRLGNPSPTPATPAMAAVARAARSRQVATRTADVLPVVRQIQAEGATSLREIARGLQAQGVQTPNGKEQWSAAQVRRLIGRSFA